MAMDVELTEIRDFLSQHSPFDELPAPVLDELPRELTVQYFRRGTAIMGRGVDNHHLYVLRTGAVDVVNRHDQLVDRGGAGTCFGSTTLVRGNPSRFDVTAIEDCLALVMQASTFHKLCADFPDFAGFFDAQRARRMRAAVASLQLSDSGAAVLKTHVRDVVRYAPIQVPPSETIAQCARRMAEVNASSLLVVRDDRIVGIVTDKDLRNRVLAVGRDPSAPVSDIMSAEPVTASADALAIEVLMDMVRRNIHHVPVLDNGRPVGIVTTNAMIRLERTNPLFLTGDIARQRDVAGLARLAARIPDVVAGLVSQDASADDIGRLVTAVGDTIERRILELVEADLGAPPVPYCWVVLGSRARHEQALAADQDNALILSDEVREEHLAYFAELARRVGDALVACGFPRCPGDVMATNPAWRQPVSGWRAAFDEWMTQPVPDAILRASVFFDMRAVHGDTSLHQQLADHIHVQAPGARLFLGHLARAAVSNEPPLGFLRNLVVEKEGEHKDTLDIKRGGVQAVVELVRVHALAVGSEEVNTRARLKAIIERGAMSEGHGANLLDAFEFIAYVRLRHQARQVRAGEAPDNFVSPDDLSAFDKRHLREAFGIIARAQTALGHRYSTSFMR